MKKKILFFCGSLEEGGAERVISLLARQFCMVYEVEILLYYDRPIHYSVPDEVKMTFIERECAGLHYFHALRWMRAYAKKCGAAVILSFLAPFNMFSIVAMAGAGIPVVVADRNDPARIPDRFFMRLARNFLYLFSDGVVLQNRRNQEYFSHRIRKKSVVIPNPLDMDEWAGAALKTEKREEIISAGRLKKQKNQKLLIRAFAIFHSSYPDYKLIIYGDGEYRKALSDYIKELALTDFVEMPGNIKNIFEHEKSAEIFVLTSDFEGMPNALLEAMRLGIPVITTKFSGIGEMIDDGKNGMLVEKDAEELSRTMQMLIEYPDLARRLARGAVETTERFDSKTISSEWIQFLEKKMR